MTSVEISTGYDLLARFSPSRFFLSLSLGDIPSLCSLTWLDSVCFFPAFANDTAMRWYLSAHFFTHMKAGEKMY
jgi:hypothetical protein